MKTKGTEDSIQVGGYVCTYSDLDKKLDATLKRKFHELFYSLSEDGTSATPSKLAWKMFYDGMSPRKLFRRFGIDFYHPTVRDAVAVDLVKLDDPSVSNDSSYTANEHISYSPSEYEKLLSHRNFRVNQITLEPVWCKVMYSNTGRIEGKRRIERQYQGLKFSKQALRYFGELLDEYYGKDGVYNNDASIENVYRPELGKLDISTEIALIPNAESKVSSVATRAYYDGEYEDYKKSLRQYGISSISTFALVDSDSGKNHTGEFYIKVQRKFNTKPVTYGYVVTKMDSKTGKFVLDSTSGKPNITIFKSENNTRLCVCERDFLDVAYDKKEASSETWVPESREVPMEHSTTSAHYSIFDQRIPDKEFDYVRNYNQFKIRLSGMEYCLAQMDSDIESKKSRIAKCFSEETIAISNLFTEICKNDDILTGLLKFYDYLAKYDDIFTKKFQLELVQDDKQKTLSKLISEYNGITNDRMDEKIELGYKIKSLKLEIGNNYGSVIEGAEKELAKIKGEMENLVEQIENLSKDETSGLSNVYENADSWKSFTDVLKASLSEEKDRILNSISNQDDADDEDERGWDVETTIIKASSDILSRRDGEESKKYEELPDFPISAIDVDKLSKLVSITEKWRNYLISIRYELSHLQKMRTPAEDATIKVRRLVNNFKERMEDVESQVWNSNHTFKKGFTFDNITSASLVDIILLHDWYACNAPGKTYSEMGFQSEEEFLEFRKDCNRISFNIRKNQYKQYIKARLLELATNIEGLSSKAEYKLMLKYPDKYGFDAKEAEEKPWSIEDVPEDSLRRVDGFMKLFNEAKPLLEQYDADEKKLKDRTVSYLKSTGLIETESDLEKLATRASVKHYEGDVVSELNKVKVVKETLDSETDKLTRYRASLQGILDRVTKCELEIARLKAENSKIFNQCIVEKNKQIRNRLLLDKLQNETKIVELQGIVSEANKKHLTDFTTLKNLQKTVDEAQKKYDSVVSEFKDEIGLDSSSIKNLIVGIYNRFQDEIIANSEES